MCGCLTGFLGLVVLVREEFLPPTLTYPTVAQGVLVKAESFAAFIAVYFSLQH